MASTLPHKDDESLRHENVLPTYCPEKAQRLTESSPKRIMSSRRLAVTFFLCFLAAYGLAAAISPRYRSPCHYGRHKQVPEAIAGEPQGEVAEGALSTLLNSVSPDSLHRMLHDYFPDRYQHGVYETDRQAVEAVHANNPAIITTIVQIVKRQDNSTSTHTSDTTTSPTKTSTTSEKPTSTTTTKPTTTSTSEESKTTTSTTTSKSSTTTTKDTTVTHSLPSSSSTTTTTSSSSSSSSSSFSEPSSDSTTTSASSTRRSSSLVTATLTSTQPNGDVTVVTATSFVEVDPTSTATTGAAGSLQTGNSAPGNPIPFPAWAGVIMGGLLLI